ncbi:MAG: C40 family peptidase [Bacteroidales bacterium]|nr:C40 family peptidase [Bacteroidales bacterium]
MKHGICLQSFIPVRFSQTDKSEMTNQLLFGETYTIIEKESKWLKIRCSYDNYTGWIDGPDVHPLTEDTFNKITRKPQLITDREVMELTLENKSRMLISPGSDLPLYDPSLNGFTINKKTYLLGKKPETGAETPSVESVLHTARKFINVPYLWGGRSVFGTDCSGFTQIVFKIHHVKIPRDASQQAFSGKYINRFEDAWPGDLAFFGNEEGNIIHVGIIMENNIIIHASGHVRTDHIDSTGIFNTEKQNYSHHLECIRRVL